MSDTLECDFLHRHARPRSPHVRQVTASLEQAARDFTAAEAQAREDNPASQALLVERRVALYAAATAFARERRRPLPA